MNIIRVEVKVKLKIIKRQCAGWGTDSSLDNLLSFISFLESTKNELPIEVKHIHHWEAGRVIK